MGFLFETGPEITEYVINTPKLEKGERKVFAVISDLHECSFGRGNAALLSAVESMEPDGVLIPGDLISAYPDGDPRETFKFMKRLKERYPKICFAPGNHERKIFERVKYTKQMVLCAKGLKYSNVPLMRNEYEDFGDSLRVYALDLNHDYYRRVIKKRVPDGMIDMLIGKRDEKRFNILLAHDPDHFDEYRKWKPDLILSGHVHGGLIRLPNGKGLISPAYRFFPKYDCGLYEKDGVKMIVSRGAGSHTFNIRINNPAEILKVVINGTGSKA
ncbi:MAG: metallophosphoesterase [Lachnospiraceae bacterium]|nr:metallophosphoesterase [Lachnospiraceae bacterium]